VSIATVAFALGSWVGSARAELPLLADPEPIISEPLNSEQTIPEQAMPEPRIPEQRMESSIRGWYSLLEEQSVESCALAELLSGAPVEFSLEAGSTPGRDDFSAWVSELRSTHSQVEYRLSAMHTRVVDGGMVRVHFSFDRYALDEAGVPHLARREQTWLLRDRSDDRPEVLRIDDQRKLAFPGTGPQIVCY
jgi:hypothetical protein